MHFYEFRFWSSIEENARPLLASEEFLLLKKCTVVDLLRRNLEVEETAIFERVVAWGESECKRYLSSVKRSTFCPFQEGPAAYASQRSERAGRCVAPCPLPADVEQEVHLGSSKIRPSYAGGNTYHIVPRLSDLTNLSNSGASGRIPLVYRQGGAVPVFYYRALSNLRLRQALIHVSCDCNARTMS